MIFEPTATFMWRAGTVVFCFFALCESAFAETWFEWKDAGGTIQLTRDAPALGVPYKKITLPDPIRWSNPPDMPEEIASESKVSVQNLFKSASQSVYWVMWRMGQGTRTSAGTVYGSAVAIKEDLAITNCHLMPGAGDEVFIGSNDPKEMAPVEVVAANFEADRCVIRVRDLTLRPVAGIRRFDTLEIGEALYAIGNPRGLARTLTDGLLSGKRDFADGRLLQTSASISPGSSGGGLFDSRGNLVGITTSSARGAQNINFAIPAEDFWK